MADGSASTAQLTRSVRRGLVVLLASAAALAACGGGDDDGGEETAFADGVAQTEDVVAAFESEAGGHEFEETTTLVEGAVAYAPESGPAVETLNEQLGEASVLWQVLVFTGADPPLDGEAARAAAFASNQFDDAGEGVYIGDQGIAYAARGNVVVTGPAAGSPDDATLTRWRAVLDGLAGDAPETAVAEAPEAEAPATEAPEVDIPEVEIPEPGATNDEPKGNGPGAGEGGGNGDGGNGPSLDPSFPGGFPELLNAVEVGDCIVALNTIQLHLGRVPVTPCASPHRGEVIEIFRMEEQRWPGVPAIRDFADEPCANELASFGPAATEVKLSIVHPDKDAWTKAAGILCVALTKKPERDDLQAQLAR